MSDKPDNRERFPTFSQQETAPLDKPLVGQPEIEGYVIADQLGEGGMGAVWRATQISTHREVALKVTHARIFGSRRALARFEREVELAARLEHPHIARVYDSGTHQKAYYYAMELIEGKALDDYVLEHKLNRRELVTLMLTVCSAIQYAHQRGIIHRDLKPSNILVTKDGQPHVLDFGLAKDLLSDRSAQTVSLDGDILGTPAFMSPEQAGGRLDVVDTRSDIYSLGVMFYLFATYRWPYDVEGTRFEVLRNIREQEAARPTTVSSSIDKDLEAILLKLLEKEPGRRYQSVTEVMQDLQNWMQGLPVRARPANNWYLLKKLILRHRVQAAIVLLLTVIILATGFIGVFSLSRVSAAKQELAVAQEAYSKEKAQDMVLINQVAFGHFLERWHELGASTPNVRAYLPAGSRECRAASFLLDPRSLAEKTHDPQYALDATQAFWQFILAEQHKKDENQEEARRAYSQCIEDAEDDKVWWVAVARARLKELRKE